ncbi:hypothetical protein [Ectobacillus panaciterrae]|uniref:hypothetical protein n=1 Tax=Ectobacillus panaciterrae TaxID=363872 RepID=UPI0004231DB6|nr:hypothetical protein [Ectobacillus panaciterrae]
MIVKVLWFLYVGFVIISAIGSIMNGRFKTIRQKLDLFVSVVVLTGVIGYIMGIELLASVIWKAIFVFGLIWDLLFTIVWYDYEKELPLPARAIGLIVIVPMYYALFQYAF